jgi:hypothetical protein
LEHLEHPHLAYKDYLSTRIDWCNWVKRATGSAGAQGLSGATGSAGAQGTTGLMVQLVLLDKEYKVLLEQLELLEQLDYLEQPGLWCNGSAGAKAKVLLVKWCNWFCWCTSTLRCWSNWSKLLG